MLIIVRHGRTVANASGLLLGRADPSLDDVGIGQAEAVAALLAAEEVGRIVSSPLSRTRQTAALIASECAVGDVELDERFIELDYGEWDERPLAEVSPDDWASWRADLEFAPPGGESLAELSARVRDGLDSLIEAAREQTVVVVTHVSPLKAAVAWALGVSDEVSWRMFVAPASICRIDVSRGVPSLHAFGESA